MTGSDHCCRPEKPSDGSGDGTAAFSLAVRRVVRDANHRARRAKHTQSGSQWLILSKSTDRDGSPQCEPALNPPAARERGEAQIRPSLPCDALRLAPPPLGDLRVVALEQHVGNGAALPFARAREVGMFDETALEALVGARGLLAHDSGDEPHARVEDGERGDLAARQYVVADRDLDEPAGLD